MNSVSTLSRPVARLSRPKTKVLLVKRWFVCWNMIYEIKFWDSSGRCLDNMLKVIFVMCCCSLILAKRQIPVGRKRTQNLRNQKNFPSRIERWQRNWIINSRVQFVQNANCAIFMLCAERKWRKREAFVWFYCHSCLVSRKTARCDSIGGSFVCEGEIIFA